MMGTNKCSVGGCIREPQKASGSAHSHLVIGRGPWGKNIARSLFELGEKNVETAGRGYEASLSSRPTHVYIATPLSTHAEVLANVIHEFDLREPWFPAIWIEKPPFVARARMAQECFTVIRPNLFFDFTLCFNPGVQLLATLPAKDPVVHVELGHGREPRPDCPWPIDWAAHAFAAALMLNGNLDAELDVSAAQIALMWKHALGMTLRHPISRQIIAHISLHQNSALPPARRVSVLSTQPALSGTFDDIENELTIYGSALNHVLSNIKPPPHEQKTPLKRALEAFHKGARNWELAWAVQGLLDQLRARLPA